MLQGDLRVLLSSVGLEEYLGALSRMLGCDTTAQLAALRPADVDQITAKPVHARKLHELITAVGPSGATLSRPREAAEAGSQRRSPTPPPPLAAKAGGQPRPRSPPDLLQLPPGPSRKLPGHGPPTSSSVSRGSSCHSSTGGSSGGSRTGGAPAARRTVPPPPPPQPYNLPPVGSWPDYPLLLRMSPDARSGVGGRRAGAGPRSAAHKRPLPTHRV